MIAADVSMIPSHSWPWCVHVNIYHMYEKPDTTIVYIHTSSIITFLILFGPRAVKQKNASEELAKHCVHVSEKCT